MKGLLEQFSKQQQLKQNQTPQLFIKRINMIINHASEKLTKEDVFQIIADKENVNITTIKENWIQHATPQQKLNTIFKEEGPKASKNKTAFDKLLQKSFAKTLLSLCNIKINKELTYVTGSYQTNYTLHQISNIAFINAYKIAKQKGLKTPNCITQNSRCARVRSALIQKATWRTQGLIWNKLKSLFNKKNFNDQRGQLIKKSHRQ